ncbi:hypothetical protein AMECASPLE_013128, partial [Ameca splendens]
VTPEIQRIQHFLFCQRCSDENYSWSGLMHSADDWRGKASQKSLSSGLFSVVPRLSVSGRHAR